MENNKSEFCEKCPCRSMCGMSHGRHWVHVLIRIAIALIIFSAGVKFGELEGFYRSGYMGGHMRPYGGWYQGQDMMYYGGPNMMYGNYPVMMGGAQRTPSSATTTGTKK